ncbi:YpoC family protein [Bacillus sp. REN3]|uniref:YpoC family protein n=1 Tax=Bacillus sp. REN3 TaxID=2802440 RepID=UPI001AEE50C4|nr:hypothetical protein [Bacillus sp. REN3]
MEGANSIAAIESAAKQVLATWNQIKPKLEIKFKTRRGDEAAELMKEGAELLKQFIFLSNEAEGQVAESLAVCTHKPMNAEERIHFIFSKPRLYHSYIQLSGLFAEQEKLHAKLTASRKQ